MSNAFINVSPARWTDCQLKMLRKCIFKTFQQEFVLAHDVHSTVVCVCVYPVCVPALVAEVHAVHGQSLCRNFATRFLMRSILKKFYWPSCLDSAAHTWASSGCSLAQVVSESGLKSAISWQSSAAAAAADWYCCTYATLPRAERELPIFWHKSWRQRTNTHKCLLALTFMRQRIKLCNISGNLAAKGSEQTQCDRECLCDCLPLSTSVPAVSLSISK